MDSRKVACILAAGFLSVTLVSAATSASAKPRDVVVTAQKHDPEVQRAVDYRDLNLAFAQDQKVLNRRISKTSWGLCTDINGPAMIETCSHEAIDSTDDQVAAAIERAQLKMAGLPVGPAVAISIVAGAR